MPRPAASGRTVVRRPPAEGGAGGPFGPLPHRVLVGVGVGLAERLLAPAAHQPALVASVDRAELP